jgi:hypothetical protein
LDCEIGEGATAGAVKIQVSFAIPVEEVTEILTVPNKREGFKQSFKADLSSVLKISASRIVIDKLSAGSLIVDFFIMAQTGTDQNEISASEARLTFETMASQPYTVGAILYGSQTFENMVDDSVIVDTPEAPSPPVVNLPDGDPDGSSGGFSIIMIVLLVLATLVFLLLSTGFVWYVYTHRDKSKGTPQFDSSPGTTVRKFERNRTTDTDPNPDVESIKVADNTDTQTTIPPERNATKTAQPPERTTPMEGGRGAAYVLPNPKDINKFYESGCLKFSSQEFTKALSEFDKAIASLTSAAPHVHTSIAGAATGLDDSEHGPFIAELTVRDLSGRLRTHSVLQVIANRFCIPLLYSRAGRLTAKNRALWPGQDATEANARLQRHLVAAKQPNQESYEAARRSWPARGG